MKHDINKGDRPVSDQESSKRGDDIVDAVNKLVERWNDGFSFQNLPESYLKAKLRVHVHCRLLPFDSGNAEKFCAMFEGYPSGRELDGTRQVGKQPIRFPASITQVDPIGDGGLCYEKSVLVYDVEHMQAPKYVPFPSLVRLGSVLI